MLFTTTVTIPITEPEFPTFITQYNPSIKTFYYHELTATYKPASHELTLFKNGNEIAKCIIENNQVILTVPSSLKARVQEYITHIFFNDNRLFK